MRGLLSKTTSLFYALKILRSHGLKEPNAHNLFDALVLSRIFYAASSWWGFATQDEKLRIQAFINRSKIFGLCRKGTEIITDLERNGNENYFTRS